MLEDLSQLEPHGRDESIEFRRTVDLYVRDVGEWSADGKVLDIQRELLI